MLEARLEEALVLKKIVDAVKELVTDANFDCSDDGISLQAMDTAHVALVTFLLRADGFESYRCDRSISIGVNVSSLAKVIRCAANEDSVSIRANENKDLLNLVFESRKKDRVCEFDLKLMDIDSEHLGIPAADFEATVEMSSLEFQRICRDLSILGESVNILVTKEGVTFRGQGDLGEGSVMLKQGGRTVDDSKNGVVVPTTITMTAPVDLSFSLKYLNNFTKATGLSDSVKLNLSSSLPMMLEYQVGELGYVRYYLAPKIEDDEE